MFKKIFGLMFFVFCVACTVGDNYKRPQFYSDAVVQNELELKESGNLPDNWYETFGDDYLNYLVKEGLANNSDIITSIAKLKQSRLMVDINNAVYLPQAGIKGSYDYQKGSKNIGYIQDADYYSNGFDASWELDIWGKGRRQKEADEADVKAQEYSLSNIRSVVVAEIVLNYIKMQENIDSLKMIRKNAELQNQITEYIQKEYQNGLSDEATYNQAMYLLQTTLSQIPEYENNIKIYKNSLSSLIGVLPSGISVSKRTSLMHKDYGYMSDEMGKLSMAIIRLRPDVAAAEQNLKAQNALLGKSIAELYPSVNIGALWGYSAKLISGLYSTSSETYSLSPAFNLPLLDWNKLQNNIEVQRQETRIALINYKQKVLDAVVELKNSFSAYQDATEMYRKKLKAQNHMQKVVENVSKRYKNGLIKFSELLTSEQNLIEAQKDVIAARAKILSSIVAYYKASGATITDN